MKNISPDNICPQKIATHIFLFIYLPWANLKENDFTEDNRITSQISNIGRYSISNINQQLTTCQQMLKFGALISFFFCNIVKNLVHLFSKVPQKVNFLKKKFKSKFFIFLVNIDVGLRWAKILYLSMSTSTNCNF